MRDEIKVNNDSGRKSLEQLNFSYHKEVIFNQKISLMDNRRIEEYGIIKELNQEVENSGKRKGIMRRLEEVAGKNKLLRGAIVAGILLTTDSAIGRTVINNKEVNNAMTNFIQGIRVEKKTSNEEIDTQRRFVEGINNPNKENFTEKTEKQEEIKEKFVEPKKGTSEYYLWKLMPGTKEEKEKIIKERRREQVEKQSAKASDEEQLGKKINIKNGRFNLRPSQSIRRIVSPETTLYTIEIQKQQQDLRQKLLDSNNYNFPKSNIHINPDASVGNVDANSSARVRIGPNVQVGNIEAEDNADMQIGTTRY